MRKSFLSTQWLDITTNDCLNTVVTLLSKLLPVILVYQILWIIILFLSPAFTLSGRLAILTDTYYQIKCFGATLSLWVVVYNLKKNIDVQTVQLLGDLRRMLNSGDKRIIHYYLMEPADRSAIINDLEKEKGDDPVTRCNTSLDERICHSNVELFDYLGTIELGVIMLDNGLITTEQFDNQFGYRLDNILSCPELMEHIHQNQKYYHYLEKYFENRD